MQWTDIFLQNLSAKYLIKLKLVQNKYCFDF